MHLSHIDIIRIGSLTLFDMYQLNSCITNINLISHYIKIVLPFWKTSSLIGFSIYWVTSKMCVLFELFPENATSTVSEFGENMNLQEEIQLTSLREKSTSSRIFKLKPASTVNYNMISCSIHISIYWIIILQDHRLNYSVIFCIDIIVRLMLVLSVYKKLVMFGCYHIIFWFQIIPLQYWLRVIYRRTSMYNLVKFIVITSWCKW